MRGQVYIRVGFIIPQQDIVWRPQGFDQVLFKQECFGFTAGDGDFDGVNSGDQGFGLGRQTGFAEVAGHPFLEVPGLTHIQHIACGVVHSVHTRPFGQLFQEAFGIELPVVPCLGRISRCVRPCRHRATRA